MKSFKEVYHMNEMARNIGSPHSFLSNYSEIRKTKFEERSKDPLFAYQIDDPNIKVQINKSKGCDEITSNDYSSNETLHYAKIDHMLSNKNLPFKYNVQNMVDRVRGGKLPPKHAQDVIMYYIDSSKTPLVSSYEQFTTGHNMWRGMSNRALSMGMHVYHHDGNKILETNSKNINQHLDDSFGKGVEFEHKHMIISKGKLRL